MKSKLELLFASLFAAAIVSAASPAVRMNGPLPIYPRGQNMNRDMPAPPAGQGVPMVLETQDSVQTVNAWYASHAPKACKRTSASGGVKYACPGGSVMIYPHGGKTQIALVPAMPSFTSH
jgi:hypothetical protein